MFETYKRTEEMRDELLWQEFVTAFRPHTIRSRNHPMIAEWKSLVEEIGVYIDIDRDRHQKETIIDMLYRKTHIETD